MSRSNPTDNSPNPATRWFEWDGSAGGLRYYNKEEKKNVAVALPFTFILLDQLATVKGWHDASDSGIFANEVKDTRAHPLVVKSFKGGILAEGLYGAIRDRIVALGGHFTTNLYIGYQSDNGLAIGSLQFKGAALGAWMDFSKEHRSDLYEKALCVTDRKEGKKGKITFNTPVFKTAPISDETNEAAVSLDRELQEYLKGYFGRSKVEQSSPPASAEEPSEGFGEKSVDEDGDEIPF